jgi:hypothetical protein
MKRVVLIALLVLGFVTLVSAQNRLPRVSTEKVTVQGGLTIVQGSLAVKSGDITYLTMGLQRFIGFIDGLKDGAMVTLEGNAITSPYNANTKYLLVSKLTIAGKDYDVGMPQMSAPRPMLPNRRQALPPRPQQPRFQTYPNLPNRRR